MQDTIWTGLMLLAAVIWIGLHEWRDIRREQKGRQKKADPVDGTDWLTYDSTGSIKQKGRELRLVTYRGKRER